MKLWLTLLPVFLLANVVTSEEPKQEQQSVGTSDGGGSDKVPEGRTSNDGNPDTTHNKADMTNQDRGANRPQDNSGWKGDQKGRDSYNRGNQYPSYGYRDQYSDRGGRWDGSPDGGKRTYDDRYSQNRNHEGDYNRGGYDRRYSDTYDDRGYNQPYGRRYDYGPRDSYDDGRYYPRYQNRGYDDENYYGDNGRYRIRRPFVRRNRQHTDSFEEQKWNFPTLDKYKIPYDPKAMDKYFLHEYKEILRKVSRNMLKLHKNMSELVPIYETLNLTDTSEEFNKNVNECMTIVQDLASEKEAQVNNESTSTSQVRDNPINNDTYVGLRTKFDQITAMIREADKTAPAWRVDDLWSKVYSCKRLFFALHGDVGHMMNTLRRTMRRYGGYYQVLSRI